MLLLRVFGIQYDIAHGVAVLVTPNVLPQLL